MPRDSARCPIVPMSPEFRGAPAGAPTPRAPAAAQQVPLCPSRPGQRGPQGGLAARGARSRRCRPLGRSPSGWGMARRPAVSPGLAAAPVSPPCPAAAHGPVRSRVPSPAESGPLCSAHTGAAAAGKLI